MSHPLFQTGRGRVAIAAQEVCAAAAAAGMVTARGSVRLAVQSGTRDLRRAVSHPGHDGGPARAIDVDQHRVVAAVLRRLVAEKIGAVELVIDSEEAPESFVREPGTLIAVVDPLDGTSVLLRRGEGYAVSVELLMVERDGSVAALAGASADSLGFATSWCHLPGGGGELAVETLRYDAGPGERQLTNEVRWIRGAQRDPRAPLAVAVVAAQPCRRQLLRERTTLLEDPVVDLDVGAGNPALHWLLSLDTHAVVELKPTRGRDAIFLAALEMADFQIAGLDGTPFSARQELERVAADPSLRIPPYVAAVDGDAFAHVLGCIVGTDAVSAS